MLFMKIVQIMTVMFSANQYKVLTSPLSVIRKESWHLNLT